MSVLLAETALPIPHAPGLFPNRPHIRHDLALDSYRACGVKLETFVSGGRRFTTHEAIERFIARTTVAAGGIAPTMPSVSKRRAAEIADAERRCQAAGI